MREEMDCLSATSLAVITFSLKAKTQKATVYTQLHATSTLIFTVFPIYYLTQGPPARQASYMSIVQVPAPALPIQLSTNVPGQAAEDGLRLGLWLQSGWARPRQPYGE